MVGKVSRHEDCNVLLIWVIFRHLGLLAGLIRVVDTAAHIDRSALRLARKRVPATDSRWMRALDKGESLEDRGTMSTAKIVDTEQLAAAFYQVVTPRQLADLLEVSFTKHLVYYLYRLPEKERYIEFALKKRNGETRTISAPATSLKLIQQKLNRVLQSIYRPKPSAHGFLPERGILTNANVHVRQKYVFNVDLKDFFDSINFGRVRGMFMAVPYERPADVATVLAQICCYKNALPQGAPTSPIVSNMLCSRLDSALTILARENNCHYTRYADDITFSWNRSRLPEEIVLIDQGTKGARLEIGKKLKNIINANGFEINKSKTRLRTRSERQEVTGIVVNSFSNLDRRYVRNVRGLIHALEKYGIERTQKTFEEKHNLKARFQDKRTPSIIQVCYGRIQYIGSVRGWEDRVYRQLRARFNQVSPTKIPVPADSWMEKIKKACWVIEDEKRAIQGTAFFLEGFGLITCLHCVGDRPHIYNPANPSKKYAVKISRGDETIDLAVLETIDPIEDRAELSPRAFASAANYGDTVTLLGYPGYALGKELSIKSGVVQGFTTRSTVRRFNISASVVAGNSGGPVLGRDQRVIGVAVTGSDSESSADETNEHGVIPIDKLHIL